MSDWFENLVDQDYLQDNLTFVSLFIALYENMTDYVESNVKDLLCDLGIKDGKMVYTETNEYICRIRKRIVDDNGNKDKTKASFLWLVDQKAITSADYEKFLQIKKIRNKYAHELSKVIIEGIPESEIALLFDMHSLHCTISRWFFIEVEAPIMGYEIPENADINGIQSSANLAFHIMLNVLYNGKSEEYKSIIASIKEGKKYEV